MEDIFCQFHCQKQAALAHVGSLDESFQFQFLQEDSSGDLLGSTKVKKSQRHYFLWPPEQCLEKPEELDEAYRPELAAILKGFI